MNLNSRMNLDSRIIGGTKVRNYIPWQVRVVDSKFRAICGGTIINKYTILTAAQCDITLNHRIRAGVKSIKEVCRELFDRFLKL